MENASKALLMVAGVLVGVVIASLAVYLFVTFGSVSAEINKQNEEQQIIQFNTQFTSYEGKECTIYDVVTIANLATENNNYYEFEKRNTMTLGKDNYISVSLYRSHISNARIFIENREKSKYEELINTDVTYAKGGDLKKYTVRTEISEITKRVYRVYIY